MNTQIREKEKRKRHGRIQWMLKVFWLFGANKPTCQTPTSIVRLSLLALASCQLPERWAYFTRLVSACFSISRELLLRWPIRNKCVTSRWLCCRRFDLHLGSRWNSRANFSQICKIDFYSGGVTMCLFPLRPHSTSLLVNLSTQDKADTWVKDSYLYHELYPIKSTCHPETLCS